MSETNNVSNATLVYKSSMRNFEYTDDHYVFTGQKNSTELEVMTSIDCGNVMKDGSYIGSFNIRFEGSESKVSINNMTPTEMIVVIPKLQALVLALEA